MSDRLYKRGAVWQCWFYDSAGRQVRRSTKCTSKRAAEIVLRRLEREATGEVDPASDTAATVAHAVTELLSEPNVNAGTAAMRETKGGHIVRLLGDINLAVLSKDDVRGFCRTRTDEGAAALTVKKELSTLSMALKVAAEKGWFRREPSDVLPKWRAKYVPRATWLTREQVERVCAHLPEQRALWVRVACLTGGRRSEVSGLRWDDIDGQWISIRGTKTDGARRRIPLAAELAGYLAAIPKQRRFGPIVGAWGNAERDLAAAAEKASDGRANAIPAVTPNDLRRTFMSWLRQAGVDAGTVAKMAGTSVEMVERVYGRLNDDAYERAIGLLPKTPGGA